MTKWDEGASGRDLEEWVGVWSPLSHGRNEEDNKTLHFRRCQRTKVYETQGLAQENIDKMADMLQKIG